MFQLFLKSHDIKKQNTKKTTQICFKKTAPSFRINSQKTIFRLNFSKHVFEIGKLFFDFCFVCLFVCLSFFFYRKLFLKNTYQTGQSFRQEIFSQKSKTK